MGKLKDCGRKSGHQDQGLPRRGESFARLPVEVVSLGEFGLGNGILRSFRCLQQGIPE
jgi:hypothetical protein